MEEINLSPDLIRFVNEHEQDDVHSLALKSKKYPDIDMELAIRQISGRKIAKSKIPSWYSSDHIIYSKSLSMEQSSSEQTARYKAALCEGTSMADLTGGLGVDFSFLSTGFKEAVYVELQPELAAIARHNFEVLGLNNATVVNSNGTDYLTDMQPVSMIYIDPARRDDTGKKTVLISDCTPDILAIEDLLDEKADMVMIKLSPMLDISLAVRSMRNISDVHIISVNNEVKELLFIKRKTADKTLYHCINIAGNNTDSYTFSREGEETAIVNYASQPDKYLYEPNTSILKAGAYKSIAAEYSFRKLHPSSHLYTSDELRTDFQGRRFEIEHICSLSKQDIKEYLSKIGQANITTRNFPLSVQEIRKKTKLKEGGDIYIFATTLSDDRKVLIVCRKA
ncbi:hypothetical protein M2451_001265 [Dysgonomonas sp. PFB1-18]|uniref:THUMP-like domain-containing protein n=1 Tax=unclassified Dysgonomonas TaxID=2630389 RepID=UPI002476B608|nr:MULTISPECIES: SAM-dependent methyltransferase [unclassified Dysgonomonas]MDH6308699.1 hypothetical protein [Dysgonomonas sp. PF1-14]MDH6338604.1 hypothetical protein [Dysgonomonas sp. PF1-16]MDH6379948.1 hypothetical protein [Dysgonomonas sp. PFB1-18]MDH6397432.1 hypothetical protein [Dysgonomonas sp. PF1-23]